MKKDINILYDIINLSSEKIIITDYTVEDTRIVFQVCWKNKYAECPNCKKRTKKKQDLHLEIWKTLLKHIRLSDGREIQIQTGKRYFKCTDCNCSFLERFDFEAESWLHTKAFEQYVLYARWYMSWSQIWRNTRCSWYKIHKMLQNIDEEILNKEWMRHMEKAEELYLWIDEHSFHWTDMILVICDLKEKIPIAILKDNRQETLKQRIKSLPMEIKDKIKWVSTDMHKTYLQTVKSVIPYVLSTIDKYHLVQEANRMVDEVRQLNKWLLKMNLVRADEIVKLGRIPKKFTKSEKNKIEKGDSKAMQKYKDKVETLDPKYFTEKELINANWVKTEFKEITYDYFINTTTTYKWLLMKREKNLSWIQRLRLRQILREFDYGWYMSESRSIKERFCDALDEKNFEEIENVMGEALESTHYRTQWFWRTLKRWKTELKNFCLYSTDDFKFTNATTESINNQCKIAKRVSHWFRHKENYFRKLSSRFIFNRIPSQKSKLSN